MSDTINELEGSEKDSFRSKIESFFSEQSTQTDQSQDGIGDADATSLDKAKSKLRSRFGSLSNVNYGKAMKAVGSTMAARLTARGMIKRASGKKEKGKLGKS